MSEILQVPLSLDPSPFLSLDLAESVRFVSHKLSLCVSPSGRFIIQAFVTGFSFVRSRISY
ncbi:hypothetical protein ACLOJK_013152 [Asimina triloba]